MKNGRGLEMCYTIEGEITWGEFYFILLKIARRDRHFFHLSRFGACAWVCEETTNMKRNEYVCSVCKNV